MDFTLLIKALTMLSLGGLLMTVGLRLSWSEVRQAMAESKLGWVLPLNFVGVPVITLLAIRIFDLPLNIAIGMMLLAASPFAPVVPIFTRMARGNLALAAGLTAVFPFVAVFLTPLVCRLSFDWIAEPGSLEFSFWEIFAVLFLTMTLPLGLGSAFRQFFPVLGQKILRPVETISELAGACSLGLVTFLEFDNILQTGWKPLLVMVLIFEISLFLGYLVSGPERGGRIVIAIGTSNRNIALAVLVALGSFPHSGVPAVVIANGLVLIFLGLLHVAWWRWSRTGLPADLNQPA